MRAVAMSMPNRQVVEFPGDIGLGLPGEFRMGQSGELGMGRRPQSRPVRIDTTPPPPSPTRRAAVRTTNLPLQLIINGIPMGLAPGTTVRISGATSVNMGQNGDFEITF